MSLWTPRIKFLRELNFFSWNLLLAHLNKSFHYLPSCSSRKFWSHFWLCFFFPIPLSIHRQIILALLSKDTSNLTISHHFPLITTHWRCTGKGWLFLEIHSGFTDLKINMGNHASEDDKSHDSQPSISTKIAKISILWYF